MFRDEPEERPRAAVKRPAAPVAIDMKRNRRFTPFGDEPEEMEGRAPSSSSKPARTSSCAVPEDADDDDEDGPAVKILSINWSGMKLFSQASFLKKVENASGTTTPKRPYDNKESCECKANFTSVPQVRCPRSKEIGFIAKEVAMQMFLECF